MNEKYYYAMVIVSVLMIAAAVALSMTIKGKYKIEKITMFVVGVFMCIGGLYGINESKEKNNPNIY